MAVRVEVQSEAGTSRNPAKVLVYEDDRLVAEVVAVAESKLSADGRWHHCVTLRNLNKATPKAKMVLHHDDPPCAARLDEYGVCPKCTLCPDMQSTCLYSYCPSCDIRLENLQCAKCGKTFERPNS